jgi:CheY-like chemotaxis protein
MSRTDRNAGEGEAEKAAPTRVIRVLLAEDDLEARRLLAHALRRDGRVVIEAANGFELVELLTGGLADLPDVIVSDIRMPGFSALDVLSILRLSLSRIPVILITGFGDAETHRAAIRLGAVAVLDKPFDVNDLRATVTRLTVPTHG